MKGHIRKRGKSSWAVVLDFGQDERGKRQQRWHTVRGTKKQAQEELTRLLHQQQTGQAIEPHRMMVGEYLGQWLEAYAQPHVTPATFARYRDICRLHLIPALGQHKLAKLSPLHIEAHYAQARASGRIDGKGGLSEKTLLQHHRVLKLALKKAIRWRLLSRNPADAVETPRPQGHEMRALDEQETGVLLDAAKGGRMYAPLAVALTTGMRRGELLALRWRDVDLKSGVLSVRQTLESANGRLQFKKPKTNKSQRTIALLGLTVEVLREHEIEQKKHRLMIGPAYRDHLGLVFPTLEGGPWSPGSFSDSFRRVLDKTNLGAVRLHDLRHTHATQLLRQGVHPKVVSERLGHSTIALTLDTYSHVMPGMQEEAAAKLDAALRSAFEPPR